MPGRVATGAADHVIDWPASPFARAVGALLARISPATRTGSARIVSVTTSQDDASGATVALALARAAAQTGLRTILVDGHVTQPMLAHLTGVQAQAGMMDVLRGSTPLNRALTRDPRSSALFLGALRPPRDPQLALASPRTQELFAHLRGICDLVVIATPPVLSAQETPYFARLSDAVVMVARPEDGPKPPLAHALKTLVEWHSPPVGMVLVR